MIRSHKVAALVAVTALTIIPSVATAQVQCVEYLGNFWTGNCLVDPGKNYAKAYSMQHMVWKGTPVLALDMGDEIMFSSLANPDSPLDIGWTAFRMPLPGDAEHIMETFSVADDVRYAFSVHRTGVAIADLGVNGVPTPATVRKWLRNDADPAADEVDFVDNETGGVVFDHNGRDFLLTHVFDDGCPDATLYEMVPGGLGVQLNQLSCVPYPAAAEAVAIEGGRQVGNALYVTFHKARVRTTNNNTSIFQIVDGVNPTLVPVVDNLFYALTSRASTYDIDATNGLLAASDILTNKVSVYAIGYGGQGSPTAPVLLSTTDVIPRTDVSPPLVQAKNVGLAYPLMYVDGGGLYNIKTPTSPTLTVAAADYFHEDAGGPQNTTNLLCLSSSGLTGLFHPSSSHLYLTRYVMAQAYDTSACAGPVQPTASLTVSPDPVFPGDPVTVSETAAGTVEQRAIWITLGSNPDATPVAGSQTLSAATPETLNWTVPAGVTLADEYWAHVAVDNVDFPYVSPTGTPLQYATKQINLDRTPEAQITFTPSAPITGDTVTVQVTAEGAPGTDTGAPPFELTVTDPSGAPTTQTWNVGQSPSPVTLSTSGTWSFAAKVDYRHEAEGGVAGINDPDGDALHEAVDSVQVTVSSVAADFTITGTGTPPLHNEDITLTSTSNATTGSTLVYDWEVCNGVTGPQNDQVCVTTVNSLPGCTLTTTSTTATCNIVSETLTPGTYDFLLRLTNQTTGDISTISKNQEIADGSINLDLTWSPTSPIIGQTVTFEATGIPSPGDVTRVAWTFTGTSCDPTKFPASQVCVPGGAITPELCLKSGIYQYSSGGTKSVTAEVTVAGVVRTVTKSLTVASTGSCPVVQTCTYSLLPTSVSMDATGGSDGFQVTTTSSSCSWTASSGYSWINVNTPSGAGTGYVLFDVDQNTTGLARTGTIQAAGRTFTVNQSATGLCTVTVTPAGGVNIGPELGSSAQFQVATPSGCEWTARSLEGWLAVTPASGTGNGTVTARATSANPYAHDRVGEVEIAGSEYTVTQYPVLPADFAADDASPNIGQWVTFTVDPRLEVKSWNFDDDDFGDRISNGRNCRGEGPIVNCAVVGQTACQTIKWNWPESGVRYVTMTLTNNDTRTVPIAVQAQGDCPCEVDPPETSFTISSNPVYAREEVTFTDTTPGAPTAKLAATMTADPTNPIIGETVGFYLDTRTADRVEWNFGATGCGGAPATATTTGPFSYATEFRYATAGTYTARATAYAGGTQIGTGSVQVIVQNTGSCDGGGGGGGTTCSYSLSPNSLIFDEDGGNGQFNVTTQTGCAWTATESLSWVQFTGGSQTGTGSGTVTYAVDPNTGAERTGTITVQGKNHAITQTAATVGPEPGPPETWDWRVTQGTDVIAEATGRVFVWEPKREGTYTVALTTSNCAGSTTATQTLEVMPPLIPPVTKLVVPSAVRAPGLNNTTWKTDLRLFNPCDGPVDVSVKFQPEGQNNVDAFLPGFEASLGAQGARAYRDVIQAIPALVNTEVKGSLVIEWDAPEDCRPLAMSKTYNETAFGTFGQFVPALAARAPLNEQLILTGLIEDEGHRTNLGFANFGEEDVVLAITLYGQGGNPIGNPVYPTVPALSTMQVVRVANAAGLTSGASDFSVKVETFGYPVKGYASVIDNDTGDPVYVLPLEEQNERVVLPGLAHLTGLNDSEWRSDVALYNAHTQAVACRIDYYADEDLGQHFFLEFQGMPPGAEYVQEDFLGFLLGNRESKGYMTVACEDGAPAPIVAARTYNRAPDGGTYGQNLVGFGELDLIPAGERAYIPGIVGSADPDSGFRTNLGIVNTSETEWLGVNMWLYDASGNEIASILDWAILPPGGFYQSNLFEPLGDVEGSLEVEVFTGGPALIYASQVDNVTQDPIFMPAIPASTLEN